MMPLSTQSSRKLKLGLQWTAGRAATSRTLRRYLQGVKVTPNDTGNHFTGAGGEAIEKFGECTTNIEGAHGRVGCRWDVADVTRPLHSVSQIAGPMEGDGNMDILFNNKRCVVVRPGVLEAVMKQIGDPIAEYQRDGNLYLGNFTMSDFIRPGQNS